jgi:hypothetical protein
MEVLHLFSGRFANVQARGVLARAILLTALLFPLAVAAQQQGPIPPPPSAAGAPHNKLPEAPVQPAASEAPKSSSSGISNQPPSIPVDQIVQRFAAREAEFKRERENYTYTQTFIIQTVDADGSPDGEYRMTSDVVFTPAGKRYEKVTFAPPPTLQRISLSEQDLDDLQHVQPFVLTTEELPKYDITYVGREQLDELNTYVFDVGPKRLEKNQRYFQGRIWVDGKDLEIVKTYGKAVPDIRTKNNENVFPRFETYRENIEGNYWFPTYTRSNDVLHFRTGDVQIRMTVRYANYKRYGVTVKIGAPVQTPQDRP